MQVLMLGPWISPCKKSAKVQNQGTKKSTNIGKKPPGSDTKGKNTKARKISIITPKTPEAKAEGSKKHRADPKAKGQELSGKNNRATSAIELQGFRE